MYSLSSATCSRLKRLPKHPVVWEGDRRSISEGMLDAFGYDSSRPDEEDEASDCIIWVDGTEGVLRAVTIVPADTGNEAVVRTLLQAMEHPQGAIPPARPHKIVVCDREIHFFLRGALRDLDVNVDYAETLPIIEEIFESLQQLDGPAESTLPESWERALNEQARKIWDTAPWNHLSDDQILKIELHRWDLEALYVSVLGMAGLEYGLLIYRSLDSLTQFRKTATTDMLSTRQMQQAFLSQDCLFLNFDLIREEDAAPLLPLPWMQSAPSEVVPEFGSLHPLEGLRTALEMEEAAALRVCLEAISQFFEHHEAQLSGADFPDLAYEVTLPDPLGDSPVKVTVQTCPDITAQIAVAEGFMDSEEADGYAGSLHFRDDYIPEGAIILLTCLPQAIIAEIQESCPYYAIAPAPSPGEMLPIVVIQTSRPKAQTLVSQLQSAKGVQSVCFNPGVDPMTGDALSLGLIQTGNGDFHLFVEFMTDNPHDSQLLHQWNQWCKKSKGMCGILIASGATGAAKGRPGPKETVAFFEAHFKTPEELNIPPLQMNYSLEWE